MVKSTTKTDNDPAAIERTRQIAIDLLAGDIRARVEAGTFDPREFRTEANAAIVNAAIDRVINDLRGEGRLCPECGILPPGLRFSRFTPSCH